MNRPGDAILFLQPEQTQQFANAYHGNLATYGLFPVGELNPGDAEWLNRWRQDETRLWVVPDYTPPEQSGWERALRSEEYLLSEGRPLGDGGGRMALYAHGRSV